MTGDCSTSAVTHASMQVRRPDDNAGISVSVCLQKRALQDNFPVTLKPILSSGRSTVPGLPRFRYHSRTLFIL